MSFRIELDAKLPKEFFLPPSQEAMQILAEMDSIRSQGGAASLDSVAYFNQMLQSPLLIWSRDGWYMAATVGGEAARNLFLPRLSHAVFPSAVYRYDIQKVYIPFPGGYISLYHDEAGDFYVKNINPPSEWGAALQRVEGLISALGLTCTLRLVEDLSDFDQAKETYALWQQGDPKAKAEMDEISASIIGSMLEHLEGRSPIERTYKYSFGCLEGISESLGAD